MNRRELVAGVASVGVLGGSVAALRYGLPSSDGSETTTEPEDDGSNGDGGDGRVELETIDARGSEAGTLDVPTDGVTLAMFFSPACGTCQRLMPELAAAHERLTAEYEELLTVVSISYRRADDELREWWLEHDGNWYLGYDPTTRLATRYRVTGYPVLLLVDADGEGRWQDNGVIDADRIVRRVEPVVEEHLENETAVDDGTGDENDA